MLGRVIAIVTFPGNVMRAATVRLLCDLLGIDIYRVDYVAGEVETGASDNPHTPPFLTLTPLVVNTALCMILCYPAALCLLAGSGSFANFSLFAPAYLGLCMGMHAFPARGMIDRYLASVRTSDGDRVSRALYIAVGWVFAGVNWLRGVWIDLLYAVIAALFLPLFMHPALV